MEEYRLVNRLKEKRRALTHYTQEELGNLVGCTRQTIIALEQNKYNPSMLLALKLAKVIDVLVEELFFLEKIEEG